VVADDRARPLADVASTPARAPSAGSETQTASFDVGELRLELSAAPGAARLVVSAGADRDVYIVDPNALETWAVATTKLLSLAPAVSPAEFRAPFLIDREGRTSIAFEAIVSDSPVAYRLLVSGAAERVARLPTRSELLRDLTEAAVGAVSIARQAT
jgi:hypothetical protein